MELNFTNIGILLTFIIGIVNSIMIYQNNKKTHYINTITSSRIKYIQEIRSSISEFCGIIYSYNTKLSKLEKTDLFELHKKADQTKYLINLYLNPEDEYWDNIIINLIDEIIQETDKNPKKKIDELILVTQYLLKLEWEGAKLESKFGILKNEKKSELYLKYKELHTAEKLKREIEKK